MSHSPAARAPAKFSLSLGSKKPAPANGTSTKRPHNLLDGDKDHEEVPQHAHIQISTFDSRSNNGTKLEVEKRIIEPIPNRDWRADSRRKRQRNGTPIHEKTDGVKSVAPQAQARNKADERPNGTPAPQTLEERAIASLTGEKSEAATGTVIAPPSPPPTEEEAFQNDYHSAPPAASLADYEATPIEGFGAALMRGYLKPGQTLESVADSRKRPDTKKEKRKDLLGLGAKEMDLGPEAAHLKEKKRGGKAKAMREAGEYNPLARVNKKTGELIGEDELQERIAAQKDTELREKDSGRDYDSSMNGHTDRHRSRGKRDERDGDRDSDRDRRRRDEDRASSKRDRYRDRYGDDDNNSYRRDRERGQERRPHDRDDKRQDRSRHGHRRRSLGRHLSQR